MQFWSRRNGRKWLSTGKHSYAVSVARLGRVIEEVTVRADDDDEAATKAERYLAANLYALKITKNETAKEDAQGGQAG